MEALGSIRDEDAGVGESGVSSTAVAGVRAASYDPPGSGEEVCAGRSAGDAGAGTAVAAGAAGAGAAGAAGAGTTGAADAAGARTAGLAGVAGAARAGAAGSGAAGAKLKRIARSGDRYGRCPQLIGLHSLGAVPGSANLCRARAAAGGAVAPPPGTSRAGLGQRNRIMGNPPCTDLFARITFTRAGVRRRGRHHGGQW